MFKRIGKKIKALAKVCCWIGIVFSVLGGISGGIVYWTMMNNETGIVVGIIVFLASAILGSLLSWISSFILYGFGELIDKVCDIEQNMRNDEQ